MNKGSESEKRSRAVPVAIALAALLGALRCGSSPSQVPRSVILVTLDTTRADRLGAYGGRAVPTPNLDAAAAEGVLFETAVSPVPMTLPAHCSILTGRYPGSHGVRHNGIYRLPEKVVTLATRLERSGFDTAAVIGAYVLNRGFGTEQGFDVYDDIPAGAGEGGQEHAFEAQRSADEVNQAVFRWLDKNRSPKFFLWVHYYDPHMPYDPPEKPGRTLEGVGYDREISYVDACFGDLMTRLRRDGLLDRSILIVVGDHGESLGEHGEETHGLLLYEAAVHVPMFFRAPGLLPAGKRIQGPASLVDVAPTVLDLLGLAPLEGADGRSLARRAAGKETGADGVVFGETLMGRLEYGWSDLFMARDARFKYVQAPVPELYDIEKDPGETKNLVRAESGKAGEMAAALGGWLARLSKKDSAAGEASRSLSPDEEERLRSLGYLAGDAFKAGGHGEGKEAARPDPKSMIEEARRLSEAGAKAARGDAAGALADVERILAGNPGNFKARELRVDVLCRLGRFDDAESEAKAGISLTKADPNSPAVVREKSLGLLATTYRRQKKLREAEATYREILALDPGGNVAPAELARVLADQGRFEEALAQAQESLKRDPGNGVALAARFVAETGLGRQAAALETAVSLATARGCDPDTSIQAGDLLMRSDKPDLAARSYAAARSQSGEDAVLLGKLGTAFLMAGKLDDAANAFRKVAELLPGDPRPDYFLGQVALKGGNTQAARAAFSRSLEKDPTFKQAREALGRL